MAARVYANVNARLGPGWYEYGESLVFSICNVPRLDGTPREMCGVCPEREGREKKYNRRAASGVDAEEGRCTHDPSPMDDAMVPVPYGSHSTRAWCSGEELNSRTVDFAPFFHLGGGLVRAVRVRIDFVHATPRTSCCYLDDLCHPTRNRSTQDVNLWQHAARAVVLRERTAGGDCDKGWIVIFFE